MRIRVSMLHKWKSVGCLIIKKIISILGNTVSQSACWWRGVTASGLFLSHNESSVSQSVESQNFREEEKV